MRSPPDTWNASSVGSSRRIRRSREAGKAGVPILVDLEVRRNVAGDELRTTIDLSDVTGPVLEAHDVSDLLEAVGSDAADPIATLVEELVDAGSWDAPNSIALDPPVLLVRPGRATLVEVEPMSA